MIEHLIINGAFIIGLSMITQPGYIMHWYRVVCESVPFLHKPLITCRLCMSSIYGLLYLLLVLHVQISEWQKIPFYLIALVFVVALLSAITELLLKLRDYISIRLDGMNMEVKDLIEQLKHDNDNN